tara:strand:+ start:3320 stop:3487 length:168 start_codon:yes stop_codon:yes gene_type:complete
MAQLNERMAALGWPLPKAVDDRREHGDDRQGDGEDSPHHAYAEVAAFAHIIQSQF